MCLRWIGVYLTSCAALLLGCGAADEARAPREEATTPDLVDFSPEVNVCPHFEGSLILPQTVFKGEFAYIAVRAVDPDADDRSLLYEWSATSGEFSQPGRAATEYRCALGGPQVLTVVTMDTRSCHVALDLDVTCLDE